MPSRDEITARAYDLYLERGAVDGYALQDWLQAEAELLDLHARVAPASTAAEV